MTNVRVLHVLAELKPSGAELMLHAAADRWRQQGIVGEILCTGERTGPLAPKLESDGFKIHHLPFTRSSRYIVDVYRFLRSQRYDVIHLHTERANFWYGVAAYASGTSHIFRTVHNSFRFQGWLRSKRRWGRQLLSCLGVKTIAVSPSVCATERERFNSRPDVILNWFEDSRFVPPTSDQRLQARARLALSAETVVVTSVAGMCTTVKNHAAIIRALASLPRSCDIVYLHIGAEDTHRSEFELATRLNLADRVRFCGMTSDPVPYLHAADVYVMPSLYEGLSCAAIEAMGIGLPAIFSKVPGLVDFADSCPGVVWVQPTPESIAEAMAMLSKIGPARRRDIGLRLAEHVHRCYGTHNGAAQYARLYLNGNHRRCGNS